MSWMDRLPNEIGDVKETKDGFSARLGLPTTEDGWFGRQCSNCELLFKMNVGSYPSAPEGEEVRLTCPYCGHSKGDHAVSMEGQLGLGARMWDEKLFPTGARIPPHVMWRTGNVVNRIFVQALGARPDRRIAGSTLVPIAVAQADKIKDARR